MAPKNLAGGCISHDVEASSTTKKVICCAMFWEFCLIAAARDPQRGPTEVSDGVRPSDGDKQQVASDPTLF